MPGATCRAFSKPRRAPRTGRSHNRHGHCERSEAISSPHFVPSRNDERYLVTEPATGFAGRQIAALLPAPGFFQRRGNLGRHVFFVVLGENAARDENAVPAEPALGNDALPFAEQIGQHAVIDDRDIGLAVGDAEIDAVAIRLVHDRLCFSTSPPMRMRRPGPIAFAARSLGL